MTLESRIQHLEEQIQTEMESRAKLLEWFSDAPSAMESGSDHSREDIATEVSVIDQSIQALREIIQRLESLAPDSSDAIQIGHIVELQIDDEDPESFLLLKGLGGIALGDLTTLSVDTPIGRAILGKRAGDRTSVKVADRELDVKIHTVESTA